MSNYMSWFHSITNALAFEVFIEMRTVRLLSTAGICLKIVSCSDTKAR